MSTDADDLNSLTIEELRTGIVLQRKEIDRLRRFETAYMEWQDKTEWVQETATGGELGKHRADVLRSRIAELEQQLASRAAPEPTDDELSAFAEEEQFLLFCDTDEFIDIARAVLCRFAAAPQPETPARGWDAQAYASMRDEIEYWKRKAAESDEALERIRNDLAPTHMGEPVVSAPAQLGAAQPAPGEWMPIETAPRDGARVLLLSKDGSAADGYWLQAAYNGCGAWIWPFVHKTPAHWQPLLAPPAAPSPEGQEGEREIIAAFLRCPEIADCSPEDKDPETRALERRARAALASQPAGEWTDRQCLEFMSAALRHVEYASGSDTPTCDDIRLGVRFALAAQQQEGRE